MVFFAFVPLQKSVNDLMMDQLFAGLICRINFTICRATNMQQKRDRDSKISVIGVNASGFSVIGNPTRCAGGKSDKLYNKLVSELPRNEKNPF